MSDFDTKGLEELLKDFQQLDNKIKKTIAKEAINDASDILLESIKQEAPRAKVNSKSSYLFLNKEISSPSDGSIQAKMGINKDNWNMTRGLWFHYWSFRSHTERDLWLDRGYDSAIHKCEDIIKNKIVEGLKK